MPSTGGSSSSTHSACSDRSRSTAPTVYSDHLSKLVRANPCDPSYNYNPDPRDSRSTYASTAVSLDENEDIPQDSPYDVIDRNTDSFPAEAVPSNPRTFASLFPSSRRLLIRHDDATLDGNMNLRVDTTVARSGYQRDVILFHLRMHDLYSRKFSFRRYCRDSGGEVCHSARKPLSSAEARWGSMLASLRRRSSGAGSPRMNRRESGDTSNTNDDLPSHRLGDTISLKFSNYAHVELKRRGGPSTHYDYEYWSTRYQWRQQCRKDGHLREVSYYLVNMRTAKPIAHILPEVLTPMEAVEEESKGGWIPPASMWISDSAVYQTMPDIAE